MQNENKIDRILSDRQKSIYIISLFILQAVHINSKLFVLVMIIDFCLILTPGDDKHKRRRQERLISNTEKILCLQELLCFSGSYSSAGIFLNMET